MQLEVDSIAGRGQVVAEPGPAPSCKLLASSGNGSSSVIVRRDVEVTSTLRAVNCCAPRVELKTQMRTSGLEAHLGPNEPDEPACAEAESTVSVRVVRSLLAAAEQAGLAPLQLLRASRFDPAQLDAADARVPRSQVYRLCEHAVELTRDPALGLHWAERLEEGFLVPISHLLTHAPSLRQAFESLARFYRLLSDQPSYQVLERHDEVTVRVLRPAAEPLRMRRFLSEMMVAGFFRRICQFSVHARPERISFEYDAPSYYAEYARVFAGPVFFQQPFTGMVFDRALLDAPALDKDDELHEALQTLAQRRLLQITQATPYALRARDVLVRSGWRDQTEMKTVARALGLSVRSLRRRLAAEGKSYHAIAGEAFAIVAKSLLRERRRTIQEAADEMGFSDASTFHRAFKRWTGITPNAYREACRQEGASAQGSVYCFSVAQPSSGSPGT